MKADQRDIDAAVRSIRLDGCDKEEELAEACAVWQTKISNAVVKHYTMVLILN